MSNYYKSTLLLPKTDFSIKVKKENTEIITNFWDKNLIYKKTQEFNENKKGNFIIHDGPPYSNGSIHIGHAFNRILKDIILRFRSSIGFKTPFILGWDTHGLPIESKVVNERKTEEKKVRIECRKYALEQIEIQKNQLEKLGLLTNYQDYYFTHDKEYEYNQLIIFSKLVEKKIIYKSLMPIYWSWSHKTALAENEVEYLEKIDFSIFFKINLSSDFYNYKNVSLLVWTTQPWTIPANMLVAVKKNIIYLLIEFSGELLIISKNFLEKIKKWNNSNIEIKKTLKGEDMIGLFYIYPYENNTKNENKNFYIIDGGDIVSELEGTGILHVAPPCGPEDFILGKKENLKINRILDKKGRFKEIIKIKDLNGVFYQDANDIVVDYLKLKKMIIKNEKILHSYPHDWRDKSPLIYRLTEQWFINLSPIKNKILKNIEKVNWLPNHSKDKMISFIKDRNDWCISRQRKWGVPIPSIKINGNSKIDNKIVKYFAQLVKEKGSDIWFEDKMKELLEKEFPNLGSNFEIEKDTLDVWFDSGVSNICILEKNNNWPADVYIEGKDQFRGWFNSSLIISTIIKNDPPYKNVISHGFVVDKNGKKMSKSVGNIINPIEVIEKFGIDTLRLWVASVDFTKEIKISNEIISRINENYQKIRNTLRFIINNIYNANELIGSESNLFMILSDIDYYLINSLQKIIINSKENYLNYRFSSIYNDLNNYCVNKLSNLYFEIIKDTLYCDNINSKRRKEIVITLYIILKNLLKIIFPIMPFLAEELYQSINLPFSDFFNKESINFLSYPDKITINYSVNIEEIYDKIDKFLIPIRKEVFFSLEKARNKKIIDSNSQASLFISISNNEQFIYLNSIFDNLEELFLVSNVFLEKSKDFSIIIEKNKNEKCDRCWRYKVLEKSLCQRCLILMEKKV